MEKLTDEQIKFLMAEGKNVIKACPGSGKTYMVANKFLRYSSNWNLYHQGVAVLSFTNVASEEVLGKIDLLRQGARGVLYPHFIGTVDSFINEYIVLRYGYLYTSGKVRPQISLSDSWNIPYAYWRTDCHRNGCVNNMNLFNYGLDGKFYKGKKIVTCQLHGKQKVLPCQQYKAMLAKKNIVFQNETALFAYELLKKYPIVAKAITERFPIIIIDEAQDTSIEQMAVFDSIINNGIKSFFLVGDPDQAIYEWRDATPECFIKKMSDKEWNTIELTGNFRSSQNICNSTCYFSASVKNEFPNNAIGNFKDEVVKPILLLTNGNGTQEIMDHFLGKCKKMNITIEPDKVAILTRGRIHAETDISELWKSKEFEWLAHATYEWLYGSRKRAFSIASKAAFGLFYGEQVEIYEMQTIIDSRVSNNLWKEYIIDLLVDAPSMNLSISEWVKEYKTHFIKISLKYKILIHPSKDINQLFKIKSRDAKVPQFNEIEVFKFFEKRQQYMYTRSSIHGVKGETYDAVLILINSKTGNTLTPSFLENGDLNSELMRIAYVAMTRPRRLLMVAMPENKKIKEFNRFPKDKWQYEFL